MRVYRVSLVSRVPFLAISLLLLASGSSAVGDIEVDFSATRECGANLVIDNAITNETLYSEVSAWSHGKMRDWTYESMDAHATDMMVRDMGVPKEETAGAACVAVHYNTLLEIPEPLKGLLELLHVSVDVEVKLKKRVCKVGRVIIEDAEIEAPLVDETRIRTRTEASDSALASKSNMHMKMPWWAAVLEAQVNDAMRRLVSEKLDAVLSKLCEVPANQRRLLQTGVSGGFLRRALDRPIGFKKQHPLKPIEPKPEVPVVQKNATEALDANATDGLFALVVEELLVLPMAAAKAAAAAKELADMSEQAAVKEQVSTEEQNDSARRPSHLATLVARRGAHARTHFLMRRRDVSEKTLNNARVY